MWYDLFCDIGNLKRKNDKGCQEIIPQIKEIR